MDLTLVNPGLLLAVIVAISLGALLKGMTGLGLPMFAVPALATITSIEEAVVLMLFPGIGANLWLVIRHRKYRHILRQHLPFIIFGFTGALFGTWLLHSVSDRALKLLLVVWLGLYLIQYFVNRKSLNLFGASKMSGYPLGIIAGAIQGATGISAQVVAPYYHARGLAREPYAYAVAFTFLAFGAGQFMAMANFELLTADRIQLSLLALVPTLVFTRIGISLARKVSFGLFNKILLVTFIAMEIKLLVDIL